MLLPLEVGHLKVTLEVNLAGIRESEGCLPGPTRRVNRNPELATVARS